MTGLGALLDQLFLALRQPNALGMGDYLLAIQALRAGQGLENVEDLHFVCRLLWAKSREDQQLFDEAFARIVVARLKPTPSAELARPTTTTTATTSDGGPAVAPPPPVDTPDLPPLKPLTALPQPTAAELRPGLLPLTFGVDTLTLRATGTYQFTPRLPISRRDMTSIWRHLRRLRRDGPAVDLDVEGTIKQLCHDGFLLRPLLKPRRRNQVRLLILVDQLGAMDVFTPWIDALIDSIRNGGLLGRVFTFYFRNVPDTAVYAQRGLVDRRPLAAVLAEYAANNCVLIISDAGAARGYYRAQRIEATRQFITALRQYTHLIAWLNPMPRARWEYTTAEDIATFVPMLPYTHQGLVDAVNVLRDRPLPPGVAAHA